MAGQTQFELEGGMTAPTLAAVTSNSFGIAAGGPKPHYSIVTMLVVVVAGLYLLDQFGFRFAVSTGRR